MSTKNYTFKISGRSARNLILGPLRAPSWAAKSDQQDQLISLLSQQGPRTAEFDTPRTFAGNWDESEFVVKRNPMTMRYPHVNDWLKIPWWAYDGSLILMNFALAIVALVLLYRVETLLPLGTVFGFLAPWGVTGIGMYLLVTWQGHALWKRIVQQAQPALDWRAAHAESVRYIGNLPAPEAEQLAQIRKTPGIGHHDIWDCALLLQEKAPLEAFISEYSRFYDPQNTNTELVETLGAKLKAARSRVQQIDTEIRTKTNNAAAISAAINDEIAEEVRAYRGAQSS